MRVCRPDDSSQIAEQQELSLVPCKRWQEADGIWARARFGENLYHAAIIIIIIITWSANPKPEAIGHARRASAATSVKPTVSPAYHDQRYSHIIFQT